MSTLMQDLRYALRGLRRNPGFTGIAVLTLALGIGANAAIFSVLHGVVLRPLDFHEPERLVRVFGGSTGTTTFSGPNFEDLRAEAEVFEELVAYDTELRTLTGLESAERISIATVTSGFFRVLGRPPVLGREFLPEEMEPGRHRVAVVSHGFWQQRLAGHAAVLGQTMVLDGEVHTIVGVAPPDFDYPAGRAVWLPLVREGMFLGRGAIWLDVLGRLRPGVTPEAAARDVERVTAQLVEAYPDNALLQTSVRPLHDVEVGEMRTPLLILLGAVGFVLLIACANVANLLLARAASRAGELGLRVALGAGRGRLVRQFLTESLVLALLGGAAGLLLASLGTRLLLALSPTWLPRVEDVTVNGTVVGFTLVVTVLTGVLFGLVPAVQVARADLRRLLAEHGRGGLGGRNRMRGGLVVVQTGLAVMLLIGAGLLLRSFAGLMQVDPGFRAERVLAFSVSLPEGSYPGDPEAREFYRQLLDRVGSLPGVQSAASVLAAPMSGTNFNISFEVAGRPPLPPGHGQGLQVGIASPDYLETVGIPILRGRGLTGFDREGAPPVALINEAAVREFFPDEDPLGQTILLGWTRDYVQVTGEVVGVVGDVRQFGLASEPVAEIYLAHAQVPNLAMTVVVRAAGDPLTLIPGLRAELQALDPSLAAGRFRTLEQDMSASAAQSRFYMLLLAIFAAVALVLASIGIFGVTSYSVSQRTREIGIRMALGAVHSLIVRQVVGRAVALASVGVALGLAGAGVLTRVLSSLLYGVSAIDPLTYALVGLAFGAVAALASFLPARRATQVDPLVVLRSE
jgi:putative ABC transport system permease protein